MLTTGTHFNYYLICHRKLWLFSNGINMESTSDLVYEGKLLHETSYPRRAEKYQEIELDGIKIDYYDPRNKVVHEIKKSDKHEEAHEWQVKYYLYVLEQKRHRRRYRLARIPEIAQNRRSAAHYARP